MHRRALALTAILAGATLTACGSGPEKTKEPPKKSRTVVKDRVSPADKDEVENHIFKLSNPNRRETPRDALVELARAARSCGTTFMIDSSRSMTPRFAGAGSPARG